MPEQKPNCRGCKKPVDRDASDALRRQFAKPKYKDDEKEQLSRTEWWHRDCFDEKHGPSPEQVEEVLHDPLELLKGGA